MTTTEPDYKAEFYDIARMDLHFETEFEQQLWNDGKNAMYFNLEDDAVISIIKNCVDNRKDIDKYCELKDVRFNLFPMKQILNYISYISRYNENIMSECFGYILSFGEAQKKVFLTAAKLYAAEKLKLKNADTEHLRNMLKEYGVYDYMQNFNVRVANLLNNENE